MGDGERSSPATGPDDPRHRFRLLREHFAADIQPRFLVMQSLLVLPDPIAIGTGRLERNLDWDRIRGEPVLDGTQRARFGMPLKALGDAGMAIGTALAADELRRGGPMPRLRDRLATRFDEPPASQFFDVQR
jgi:hypothetical protein